MAEDGSTRLRTLVEESLTAKRALLDDDALLKQAGTLAERMTTALQQGGKVILFGNGGSAADATHLAAELVGKFAFARPPLPALSLTDNVSSVTAIGNDFSYEEVFERQVRAFGRPGDLAIGLSTSGTSANVVRGVLAARDIGLPTAAFTGQGGGALMDAAEECLRMPSTSTARIQECYMLLCHSICEIVEQRIFGR